MEQAWAEPDKPIGQLNILTREERLSHVVGAERLIEDQLPVSASVVELFEAQVQLYPDAVAVVYEGESLTYAELNVQANRLAHYLIAQGVGPEQIVGLLLPRSTLMLVGVLAVLKAGAGYLPLDPDYPLDRLAFMLEDTQPACVIGCLETAVILGDEVLIVDEPQTSEILSRYIELNPTNDDRVRRYRRITWRISFIPRARQAGPKVS